MIKRNMQMRYETSTLGGVTVYRLPTDKVIRDLTGVMLRSDPSYNPKPFFVDKNGKLWSTQVIGRSSPLHKLGTSYLIRSMHKLGMISSTQAEVELQMLAEHTAKAEHDNTLRDLEQLHAKGVKISQAEIKRLEKLAGRKADLTPRLVKGE